MNELPKIKTCKQTLICVGAVLTLKYTYRLDIQFNTDVIRTNDIQIHGRFEHLANWSH